MDASLLFLLSLPLLVAMLLAAGGVVLLLGSIQSLVMGVALVLGTALVDSLQSGQPLLHIGLALYPGDLMCLILVPAALVRWLRPARMPDERPAVPLGWWVFSAAVMLSLAQGLLSFGTKAGVQVRDYFYFVVVVSYVTSFPYRPELLQRLLAWLAGLGGLLLLLTTYRWIVYYTPIPSLLPPGGVYNIDGPIRVIWSNDALLLGQLLIGALYFADAAPALRTLRLWVPVLLGYVLALQHRSVWGAVLVGALSPLLSGRRAASAWRQLGLFALILAVVVLPLLLAPRSELAAQIGQSAQRAVRGQDTTAERLQSWGVILRRWVDLGPRSIAIGNPFGTDNSRYVIDSGGTPRLLEYGAHNMYVQTVFNTGLLGLAGFLAALVAVLRGLRRRIAAEPSQPLPVLLFTLNVTLVVYFVPYGVTYVQGLWLGLGAACAAVVQAPVSWRGGRHAAA